MNEIKIIKDFWMRDFKELFGELVKAGVHFGHQKSRWCPKMEPYIWGYKNKVHLIDVSKTAAQLDKSEKFLESVAAEGKTILWVGTKKAASAPIKDMAVSLNMPYVNHRWLGGTLLNFSQVKKSLTRLLHYEDILAKAESNPFYTKKELNLFKKTVDKLEKTPSQKYQEHKDSAKTFQGPQTCSLLVAPTLPPYVFPPSRQLHTHAINDREPYV